MSKWIVSSACAAAVLSFAVATAQTAPRTQTNRGARTDAQQVVISGCVARGTGATQAGQYLLNNAVMANTPTGQIGAVGTLSVDGIEATGTIAGGVTPSTTTENGETPATQRVPGAVGTSGRSIEDQTRRGATGGRTSGTTTGSADAHASAYPSSYLLVPGRTDLSMWVGQRVEITGRIVSNAGGSPTTGTAGTASSTHSANNMQRLQVTSVRAIPGNCL